MTQSDLVLESKLFDRIDKKQLYTEDKLSTNTQIIHYVAADGEKEIKMNMFLSRSDIFIVLFSFILTYLQPAYFPLICQ